MRILEEKIADRKCLSLLENVISSYSLNSNKLAGLPIGNLASQIFANIMLDKLDVFVKEQLRIKEYFRYADDCLLISNSPLELQNAFAEMACFIETALHLRFHPNKVILRAYGQGIDFLGVVLRPHYKVLRTKTKRRMLKKLLTRFDERERNEISSVDFNATKNSYKALLTGVDGHFLQENIANNFCTLGDF